MCVWDLEEKKWAPFGAAKTVANATNEHMLRELCYVVRQTSKFMH